MSRKQKRLPSVASADTKQVRITPKSMITNSPLWAFCCADVGGPWCWSKLSSIKLVDVISRLGSFETMTWASIEGDASHFVETSMLCKQAQKRLTDIGRDDVDELFSLRISGKERIWGIRYEHVLRLLWWDPLHQVCPSAKRHT